MDRWLEAAFEIVASKDGVKVAGHAVRDFDGFDTEDALDVVADDGVGVVEVADVWVPA